MLDSKSESIIRTASKSGAFLIVRQIIVQAINLLVNFLLARLLTPSEYAIVSIIGVITAFLLAFGGTGLASAFLMKPEVPSDKDYSSMAGVQMVAVLLIASLLFIMSPWISNAFSYGGQGTLTFRLIAISFLFIGLTIIPQVKMERDLDFGRIAIIEVTQVVVYSLVVIGCILSGLGIASFGYALLARYVAALIATHFVFHIHLKMNLDFSQIIEEIKFGFNVQLAQIINLVKDVAVPALIGGLSGASAVGFIGWSTMVMNYPSLVIIILNRIYVPLFAKFADNTEGFKFLLGNICNIILSIVFFLCSVIFIFRNEIDSYLFLGRWQEALTLFLPFLLINILLAPTMLASQGLIALGDSRSNLHLMITWTVLTWVLSLIILPKYGWSSWGWINLVVNIPNMIIWSRLNKISGFNIYPIVLKTASLMLIIIVIDGLIMNYNQNVLSHLIPLILGGIIYILINQKYLKSMLLVLRGGK